MSNKSLFEELSQFNFEWPGLTTESFDFDRSIFETTEDHICKRFPIKVANDLRMKPGGKQIAVINRFTEGSPLAALASRDEDREKVFYHVFTGECAPRVREIINWIISGGRGVKAEEVNLFRKEGDHLIAYSYGEICIDLVKNQEHLKELLPEELKNESVFVLPLRLFRFECPVCKKRTIAWRGILSEWCTECGWLDDCACITDDNEESLLNNGETVLSHREKYMEQKRRKPDYKWIRDSDDEDS